MLKLDMHQGKAKSSELVIYEDGTLYHIDVKRADNIPPNIFLVGAAGRVQKIAKFFDKIIFRHRNSARPEFCTVAGIYKKVPMAVMSTGIGVDNIEIVLNELHALFEYDHKKNEWSDKPAKLNIIRVGTCGVSAKDIRVGSVVVSDYSIGLDNLGAYYPAKQKGKQAALIEKKFGKTVLGKINSLSYCSGANKQVAQTLYKIALDAGETKETIKRGITTASPGFFAPEGRSIGRLKAALTLNDFIKTINGFDVNGLKILNHEMETSILFRMANEILGYRAGAICLVLDNLSTDDFITKKEADKRMDKCIKIAVESMFKVAKS